MRRSLAVCRNGLSLVAALALLTACGGSDGDDTAASTTSSSASAATTSAAETATPEFCARAAGLLAQLTPALTSTADPGTLAPALAQAATDARAIEPPASIADDWSALTDGVDQFATAAAAVNPSDPASMEQFMQLKAQLLSQLAGAAGSVQSYLAEDCGLPTGSAAPTS